ncbi:MAG: CvpA family protein [Lachnospiraceae bacterium]|nr:CvpA family protein [Lachnospiraceae bacterium]
MGITSTNLFLIIIAVMAVGYFSGRRAGLIKTLIPIMTAFASMFVFATVFPIFKRDVVGDTLGFELTDVLIDILAFAVVFIIIRWVIRFVFRSLKLIGDAPVVSSLNRFLGGVAGLIGGLVLIWIVFFFMAVLYKEQELSEFYHAVNGNEFVKLIYNHNLIMTFVNYFVFA